ncbi:MAG TPA: helicase, partial [Sarcina sp.]|nr:helicase [Sarcina sp.]
VSCSIIYGALPYDVRHKQAELFAAGKTDVVVATDAIGMGMNLPIRRVVLMETVKYDGFERRSLTYGEI